ncbi:ATP synthase F1 subunit delta [bacterium]|nr:ATP synthase F1 subunit delta [bacterium]MBU1983698.1 ATP synthase F1 subunit delta [bacterium]
MRRISGALVRRYARALFQAADQASVLPAVRDDLAAVTGAWRENPEFAQLVLNPRLSRGKVRALLMALADRVAAQTLTRNFLELLLEKDRMDVLAQLGPHFNRLWRDHQGEIEVTVTTAVPIGDALKQTVLDHLARRSGKKPVVAWRNDESLLGGIVVEWPDRVFDGSLARKLENLRASLAPPIFAPSQSSL